MPSVSGPLLGRSRGRRSPCPPHVPKADSHPVAGLTSRLGGHRLARPTPSRARNIALGERLREREGCASDAPISSPSSLVRALLGQAEGPTAQVSDHGRVRVCDPSADVSVAVPSRRGAAPLGAAGPRAARRGRAGRAGEVPRTESPKRSERHFATRRAGPPPGLHPATRAGSRSPTSPGARALDGPRRPAPTKLAGRRTPGRPRARNSPCPHGPRPLAS